MRDFEIVAQHIELGLAPPQRDIIARQICLDQQENKASVILGRVLPGIGRLDRTSHPAPQVDFPGGIEPTVEHIEGRRSIVRDRARAIWIGPHARIGGCSPDRGKALAAGNPALRARLLKAGRGRLDVEILCGNAFLKRRQHRIVERGPPFIGWRGFVQASTCGCLMTFEQRGHRRHVSRRPKVRSDCTRTKQSGEGCRTDEVQAQVHRVLGSVPTGAPLGAFTSTVGTTDMPTRRSFAFS